MKITHLNCGLRNEYESDLRSNERYFCSSENKVWNPPSLPAPPPSLSLSLSLSLSPDDEEFITLL